MDELLGQGLGDGRLIDVYLDAIGERPLDVLTLHAEVEDVAREIDTGRLPVCDVVQGTLPGRAGTVSCQAMTAGENAS